MLLAKKSLKEYQYAVRNAMDFLQQLKAKLLMATISFKDCTEELHHTQEILSSLLEGYKAHMALIGAKFPQQKCFPAEKLHIQTVSRILVDVATIEAQIKLKLEFLQR